MLTRLLADGVLLLHLAFIAFVVLGGWLARRWRWLAWLHVPALAWGVIVEWSGSICPLTYLENHFLRLAGEAGYAGGFIERYVWPLIYPQGLERWHPFALGALVLLINLAAYATWALATRSRNSPTT